MNIKIVLLGIFLLMSSIFANYNVSDSVSVGSYLFIEANFPSVNTMTLCSVSTADRFGNVVQHFTYSNDNFILTDSDGYLRTSIFIDDRYAIGENYTVSTYCRGTTYSQNVTMDVGGNVGVSLLAINWLTYFRTHPQEVFIAMGAFIIFMAIVWWLFTWYVKIKYGRR